MSVCIPGTSEYDAKSCREQQSIHDLFIFGPTTCSHTRNVNQYASLHLPSNQPHCMYWLDKDPEAYKKWKWATSQPNVYNYTKYRQALSLPNGKERDDAIANAHVISFPTAMPQAFWNHKFGGGVQMWAIGEPAVNDQTNSVAQSRTFIGSSPSSSSSSSTSLSSSSSSSSLSSTNSSIVVPPQTSTDLKTLLSQNPNILFRYPNWCGHSVAGAKRIHELGLPCLVVQGERDEYTDEVRQALVKMRPDSNTWSMPLFIWNGVAIGGADILSNWVPQH